MVKLRVLLLLACACSTDPNVAPDSGVADSGAADSGAADSGAADSGAADSGAADSGAPATDGGVEDPLMLCPGGALRHYSLTPIANLPPLSELELTGLPNGANVVSAGTGVGRSGRFDVCEEGGVSTFRGFLFWPDDFGSPLYIRLDETITAPVMDVIDIGGFVLQFRLPPSAIVIEGFEEALSGALDPLEIRVLGEFGLLILGHASYLAIARGNVTATSITYNAIDVIVGGLAPGDVFAGNRCRFGEYPRDVSFQIGTADFDLEACTFQEAGFTSGYRITRLSVEDASPELTAAEQARIELDGATAVESVMNYVYNHHNACDSFHLALPHADYAATTSPAAGCGAAVPNAPERDIDENPVGPVLTRVRYHGGAWIDGTIPGCNHYLFCD